VNRWPFAIAVKDGRPFTFAGLSAEKPGSIGWCLGTVAFCANYPSLLLRTQFGRASQL
jgi:hypothetical protein